MAAMQSGSVRISPVSGLVSRPSVASPQAVQTQPSSVVLSPGVKYQTAAAAPVTRVVSSQAATPATAAYPSTTRTVVVKGASASAAPAAYTASSPASLSSSVRKISLSGTAVASSPLSATVGSGTVICSKQVAPQVVRTVRKSAVTSTSAPRPVTVQGPTYTQGAYEAKHQHDDPQLKSLKELRRTSGLKTVPVVDGLAALKSGAENGKLTRQKFLESYEALLQTHGVEAPPEAVQSAVWDLFDRDGNHVVDLMELICGISLLCAGTEEEKIHAVFEIFDANSDGVISMDEMFKFLTSVFKVVLTPNVLGVMNSMGVNVESAEDLASVTALECFKNADLNHDGKLSVSEFKNWFYTPRNDPSALFSPTRKLLQ